MNRSFYIPGCFFFFIAMLCQMGGIQAQTEPKLMLPVGHTDIITSVAFSPDGKRLLTGSYDKTVKIWDATNGQLLIDMSGLIMHGVFSALFSPDGENIMLNSFAAESKIYNANTGQSLQALSIVTSECYKAEFSNDGSKVLMVNYDTTVKIINLNSGQILANIKGHSPWIRVATFSPDGNEVLTAWNDTAIIWDANSGQQIARLHGIDSEINSACYSPDGDKILTVLYKNSFSPGGRKVLTYYEDTDVKIWDAKTGQFILGLDTYSAQESAIYSPDGNKIVSYSSRNSNDTIKIWDATNGLLLAKLFRDPDDIVGLNKVVMFSPDSKVLVTVDYNSAKIWDSNTGILELELTGHSSEITSVAFSPDGKTIATASSDESVKVWKTNTGKLLLNIKGHTNSLESADYSPDGSKVVTCGSNTKIWDAGDGKPLVDSIAHDSYVISAAFSPENKTLVTASQNSIIEIWDAFSGNKLDFFSSRYIRGFNSVSLSPDGKKLLATFDDNRARVWDISTGEFLVILNGHEDKVVSALFSPDGNKIITASWDHTAKIWDASSGKLLVDIIEDWYMHSASFSPDGSRILTASMDTTAKIRDADTGQPIISLIGHASGIVSAEFSPDGKRVVTASYDNTAKIWDALTGSLLADLIGHTTSLKSAVFAPDGNYVLTASEDNTAKIWNASTGQLLYTFIAIDELDYLVVDPYYRYDGTEAARELLYFTCCTEVIDLAQMKDALYVPGLVEKIMTGQEINYPKLEDLDICDALPLIEQIEKNDGGYHYSITQRRLPLEYIEVYVNGKRVMTVSAGQLIKKDDIFFLDLPYADLLKHFIPGERNEVEVVGIVKENGNILKSRGVAVLQDIPEDPALSPSLYALMIGVNDYKDENLHLNFPAKDAQDLGSAIEISAKKLLGREHVYLYQVNSNVSAGQGFTTPEKEGIRKAFEDIAKKAKPEDVILIFFAGHGVMQGNEDKRFTFLTAEASSLNQAGISTRDLESWLSYDGPFHMLANKTILIFDACHSGQATQELLALARTDDETQRIRQVEDLKDKSGMFILAASAPDQSAYELPRYGQGLLTYSLLHTLKNNPDILDDNRFLNVQKWFLESEKYLQQLMSSLGYDQDAQPFGTANIRIGVVDEEVRNSIRLAAEKPVILCANVLNTVTFSDDLQLKNRINRHLEEISERGTDSRIVYSRQETPGANLINIMYQVSGTAVSCQVRLMKGSEQLGQADVQGSTGDLEGLAEDIISEVMEFAR